MINDINVIIYYFIIIYYYKIYFMQPTRVQPT